MKPGNDFGRAGLRLSAGCVIWCVSYSLPGLAFLRLGQPLELGYLAHCSLVWPLIPTTTRCRRAGQCGSLLIPNEYGAIQFALLVGQGGVVSLVVATE